MENQKLRRAMQTGVFWITNCIAQGAFPENEQVLLEEGITHILNVCGVPNVIRPSASGITQVEVIEIEDMKRITETVAIQCTDILHKMLSLPNSKVFVHCVAGQNRSPAVVFLYLVACGLTHKQAMSAIADRTLDAVPAHPALIDNALIKCLSAHGKASYQPLTRPEIIRLF